MDTNNKIWHIIKSVKYVLCIKLNSEPEYRYHQYLQTQPDGISLSLQVNPGDGAMSVIVFLYDFMNYTSRDLNFTTR